jgi:hypothetical protein
MREKLRWTTEPNLHENPDLWHLSNPSIELLNTPSTDPRTQLSRETRNFRALCDKLTIEGVYVAFLLHHCRGKLATELLGFLLPRIDYSAIVQCFVRGLLRNARVLPGESLGEYHNGHKGS